MADIIILGGLLCAEPPAVRQAIAASNFEGIESLGCAIHKPYRLGFRVLRCEPRNMEVSQKSFSYPVRRDATLPYGVCEVEAILADGQVVTAYTDYVLIYPWSENRLSIPRYEGPKGE